MLFSFLAQSTTPDTTGGLIFGYVVLGVIAVGYLVSMVMRQRNLLRDVQTLDSLSDDD